MPFFGLSAEEIHTDSEIFHHHSNGVQEVPRGQALLARIRNEREIRRLML